jgi:DNA-binding transcriptional ArsR family regulator
MYVESIDTELSALRARARVHAALGDPSRLAIIDALTLGDASPGEIAHDLDLPTNLVAHHVNVLHDAGLIVRTRSEGDRRRTYLSLVPDVLASLTPPPLRNAGRATPAGWCSSASTTQPVPHSPPPCGAGGSAARSPPPGPNQPPGSIPAR